MKKRILAMLLTLIISASALGGCAQEKKSSTGDKPNESKTDVKDESLFDENGRYKEEITITAVLSHGAPTEDVPSDTKPESFAFIKAAKEKLNINLKWLWTAPPEQFDQKLGVAMASGDLPDIMNLNNVDYENLKENDQLAELSGVLQYAGDNLKTFLNRDPGFIDSMRNSEGELYAIPRYVDVRREMNMLYIRQDWLDELNLQIPKTTDELKTVMAAFKKKASAKQGIALSGQHVSDWGSDIRGMLNMFGSAPQAWIDKGDGKLVAGEIQPETKVGLAYLADCYKEGLLNKEFVAMDVSKSQEDVVGGKTGMLLGPWWIYESCINLCMEKDASAKWVTAPIPSYQDTGKALIPRKAITNYKVVNSTCKNPEAFMKLMNLSVDGLVDFEDYAQNKNGYFWGWDPSFYNDPFDIQSTYDRFNTELKTNPTMSGDMPESFDGSDTNFWRVMPDFLKYKAGDLSVVKGNEIVFGGIMARIDADCGWGTTIKIAESKDFIYNEFYGPATETMKEKEPTLIKLLDETFLKIIMGEAPIDSFDKYVSDWSKLGGDAITEEINKWYQLNK